MLRIKLVAESDGSMAIQQNLSIKRCQVNTKVGVIISVGRLESEDVRGKRET